MWIKCQKCGHEWDYKGKSPFYAHCGVCNSRVSLLKGAKRYRETRGPPAGENLRRSQEEAIQ